MATFALCIKPTSALAPEQAPEAANCCIHRSTIRLSIEQREVDCRRLVEDIRIDLMVRIGLTPIADCIKLAATQHTDYFKEGIVAATAQVAIH